MSSTSESSQLRTALKDFADWRRNFLTGDEKGESQTFLDRLFRAFGHAGIKEAGATLEFRLKKNSGEPGARGTAFADLMWKPRVLVEMKRSGTDLSKHYRQAFDYWVQAVPDRPQFVVLCNFDEFWIYDFDSQLDEPVDRVKIENLPSQWEALSFLLPSPTRPVFSNDLVEVTRDAAALVAEVFRDIYRRTGNRNQAQRFVLQSVMSMFAEDIGLLPSHLFTLALEDCLEADNPSEQAYELLFGLFREMNTPGVTSGGRYKGTPYFNGGLFADIQPFELSIKELAVLRSAARTNWSFVRPEIFGTLFEQSMNSGARHAQGAHFTSQADIARIVIPTIVSPWRDRIQAARTRGGGGVPALKALLVELSNFQVLDPACGSGNFLYVAYREMRRLEREIQEAISTLAPATTPAGQQGLAYVTADQFHGMDINEFAVEIAKITMMLGKKLASDELGDIEGVLPLENLDSSIINADALFHTWPKADVIIGNPPYLGRRKMIAELGSEYTTRLATAYPGIKGVSDFVCYWFPLAHDHLPLGGRAGLVATNTVRENDSRIASLDYIVDNDGVIFDAVSSQPWSGDAAVHVSIVNWIKTGPDITAPTPKNLWINNAQLRLELDHIPSSLSASIDVRNAADLDKNMNPAVVFQGQTPGITKGYVLSAEDGVRLQTADAGSCKVVHPYLIGQKMLHGFAVTQWIIDIPDSDMLEADEAYPAAMAHLRAHVLPDRMTKADEERAKNKEILDRNPSARINDQHEKFLGKWWQQWRRRGELVEKISRLDRYIATSRTTTVNRLAVFEFVDARVRPGDALTVFSLDDDYSFGILSSSVHAAWIKARCSNYKSDPRYTSTTVWDSYPWPQAPTHQQVLAVVTAAEGLLLVRSEYLAKGKSLAAQYDSLKEPGHSRLRSCQEALDTAVLNAYGFTTNEDLLTQIFALNQDIAKDPAAAVAPGPGHWEGTRVTTYKRYL